MELSLPWIVFFAYILILLFVDFVILNKKGKLNSVKKTTFETIFFIVNSLLFSLFLFWCYDHSLLDNSGNLSATEAWIKYITAYLVELSLSVDNLFVIAVIFSSFKIPSQYQHNLLFLGIIGAIVFRAILIGLGLALFNQVHGMNIVFGAFLLFTAFKMLRKDKPSQEISESKGFFSRFKFPKELDGAKFITKKNGKFVLTGLFGALLTIELTDLLFALDSIPAVFAVTTDPFIVYSSNIFAIMGLRSMYFFLAKMLEQFSYIKYSIFAILLFVGFKLILASWLIIPEWVSLSFIGCSLMIGIYLSKLKGKA